MQSNDDNPVVLHAKRGATVYLLGTMHVAEASAKAACALIQREHERALLGAIFLELDDERRARLEQKPKGSEDSLFEHLVSVARRGRAPGAAAVELAMTALYRVLHRVGFASGVEFRAALGLASTLTPPPSIVLGDQHVRVTLARIAEGVASDLSLAKLVSFLTNPPASDGRVERQITQAVQLVASGQTAAAQKMLEEMLDRNTARALVEPLRKVAPNVTNAILDERDSVMAARLHQVATEYPEKSVVAIVGLAHVDGIVRRWNVLAG